MSNSQAKRDKGRLVSEDAYNDGLKEQRQQHNIGKKTTRLAQENNRQDNKTRYNNSLGEKNIKPEQKEAPYQAQTKDDGWKGKKKKRTPNMEILDGSKQPPSQNNSEGCLKRKCYCAEIRTRTKRVPLSQKQLASPYVLYQTFLRGFECTALFSRHYYLVLVPINIISHNAFVFFSPRNGIL